METFRGHRIRRWTGWLLFAAGLVLSAVMVARSQLGGDQLNLLARGWLLAERGELVPYGNPTSTGGVEPGAMTSLLVGLPLEAWSDHRAPVVLIFLFHLAGYLLLDRVVGEVLGARGRWLLCALYWINPWRLYHSAFLWNPNYLFLLGVLHTWSAYRLRESPRWLPSFLHALTLAAAAQLHPAALIPALVSAALWLQGRFRVSWTGLAAGAAAGSLTLIPWLAAVAAEPSLHPMEGGHGFPGSGLVLVFPVVKALLYWFRYASLLLPHRALTFDFADLGGAAGTAFEVGLAAAFGAAGVLGVGLALAANLRLWIRPSAPASGRGGSRWWRRLRGPWEVEDRSPRGWLRSYTGWTLAAGLVVFALSPTTPQSWQGLIVLHAAVMPVVLLADALLRSARHRARARAALAAHAALSLALALVTALASPHYRCGGRDALRLALRYDSPMLHQLGVHATCPLPVGKRDGWWPDVLPAASRTAPADAPPREPDRRILAGGASKPANGSPTSSPTDRGGTS